MLCASDKPLSYRADHKSLVFLIFHTLKTIRLYSGMASNHSKHDSCGDQTLSAQPRESFRAKVMVQTGTTSVAFRVYGLGFGRGQRYLQGSMDLVEEVKWSTRRLFE